MFKRSNPNTEKGELRKILMTPPRYGRVILIETQNPLRALLN